MQGTEANEEDVVFDVSTMKQRADTDLGYFCWKPSWLQCLNNSKTALVLLCCLACTQSFITIGSVKINIQMLEKRFNLDSTQVSLIVSTYDAVQMVLVLPIGFFGHNWHKPRTIAIAATSTCMGSLLMSLPHLVTPEYELGQSFLDVCAANTTSSCGNGEVSFHSEVLYVFMLAQACNAIGGALLYTLAIVYIDESVETHSTPLYIGVFAMSSTIGPAMGFILGGELLSVYVDVDKGIKPAITTEDPRWVGAWWISFLIGSAMALFCSFTLCCLGRELPGTAALRKSRTNETSRKLADNQEVLLSKITIREMPKNTLNLLTNKTYVLIVLALTLKGLVINGMGTFLPKFIQNQYSLEPTWAAMITGLIVIPGAGGAEVMGGYLPKRLKLDVRGLIRLSLGFMILGVIGQPILLTMCDVPDMPGINQPYNMNDSLSVINLMDRCNAHCNCSTLTWEPICGINNREYFSPCHAGCDTLQKNMDGKTYGNCSCISPYTVTMNDTGQTSKHNTTAEATAGRCPSSCKLLPLFIVILTIVIFCVFMPTVPTVSATLRVVPYRQRSYAIALKGFIGRCVGAIPGPVIFGAAIDSSCVEWQEKCGERGTCWVYDNRALGLRMCVINVAVLIPAAFLYFFAQCTRSANPMEDILVGMNVRRDVRDGNVESDLEEKMLPHEIDASAL